MNNYDDLLNNAPAEPQSGQLSKEEYADKKRAEREEVFALSDSTALEVAGNGGKFRQYLDVQSRFDRYSAVNALLILAQKPEATRIGDFDYWKGIGGFVRPRQSAISILEPHEYLKEDGSPGIGYNSDVLPPPVEVGASWDVSANADIITKLSPFVQWFLYIFMLSRAYDSPLALC